MKSFEESFSSDELSLAGAMPISGLRKAYNAGAEEKEKEMLRFFDWYQSDDAIHLIAGNGIYSRDDALAYWKKEVEGK